MKKSAILFVVYLNTFVFNINLVVLSLGILLDGGQSRSYGITSFVTVTMEVSGDMAIKTL